MLRTSLILAVVLAALPARAAELGGVRLPDSVTIDGSKLVLNGLGLREATFLKVDVYVCGLYLPAKTKDPRKILASPGPKRLVQHFVRSVDRDDVVETSRKGIAKNSPGLMPKVADRVEKLLGWFPAIEKGDVVQHTHLPGKGVVVEHNGRKLGVIPGDDFARALFAAWLGKHPPNAGLKRGMLGK